MTTVHTLASGSSGNAAVLSCGDTHLLLDAGISCRRITTALNALGLSPELLSAILITHTHSDHISGLRTLLKKTDCPILATPRACRELRYRLEETDGRLIHFFPAFDSPTFFFLLCGSAILPGGLFCFTGKFNEVSCKTKKISSQKRDEI